MKLLRVSIWEPYHMRRDRSSFLHGNYGEPVDGARECAQAVQLTGHLHRPRPKADGVISICWLAKKVASLVCRDSSHVSPLHAPRRKVRHEAMQGV